MANPIAIFGTTTDEFIQKVFDLRQKFQEKGYYSEKSEQLFTVPHLTLGVNKDFDFGNIDEVESIILKVTSIQRGFNINIEKFIVMQKNVAALFDNSFTKQIAEKLTTPLAKLGFEVVMTDHMRLIRSEIKEEYLEKVRASVDSVLPKEIKINGVAIAGKLLRQEDILWRTPLL